MCASHGMLTSLSSSACPRQCLVPLSRSLHGTRGRARRMVTAHAGSGKPVLALDFDGVICDSVGESSASAWVASAKLWPELFAEKGVEQQKERVMQQMEVVRPVVETGYENIVQIRCLLHGVPPEDMLHDWHTILPQHMEKWSLDRSQLVEMFGGTRDELIKQDLGAWLAQNRIYPGVAESLRTAVAEHETYVVTTKQARFTEALLKDMAKVPFDPDRIFSQAESGRPKTEVLARLQQRHSSASSMHFVEDKLGTLDKVCADSKLASWNLYLVDWGYNTEDERKRASQNERIHIINHSQFSTLLESGSSC